MTRHAQSMLGISCKICFLIFYRVESVLNGGLVLKHYHLPLITFLVFFDSSFMHKDFNIHTLHIFQSLNHWKSKSDGYSGGKRFNRLKTLLDSLSENKYSAISNNYHNTRKLFLQLNMLQSFLNLAISLIFINSYKIQNEADV